MLVFRRRFLFDWYFSESFDVAINRSNRLMTEDKHLNWSTNAPIELQTFSNSKTSDDWSEFKAFVIRAIRMDEISND